MHPQCIAKRIELYLSGYTLNDAEKLLLFEAIARLKDQDNSPPLTALPPNIVPPNYVCVDKETKAIGSTTPVKRRGCPPGGWPKKDKPPEHD